jgi:hypothetical protein
MKSIKTLTRSLKQAEERCENLQMSFKFSPNKKEKSSGEDSRVKGLEMSLAESENLTQELKEKELGY